MSGLSVSTGTGCVSTQVSISPMDRAKSVCEALRSALPSYDTVMSILSKNDTWWRSNRIKTHALSQTPLESIESFAPRAYTSRLPGDVGTLVIAYAYSSGDRYDLYTLVERLVISEFSYLATTEGMKCIVHLAKAHTDIGQPRKAWMLWRRAMTVAQLLVSYIWFLYTLSSRCSILTKSRACIKSLRDHFPSIQYGGKYTRAIDL